MAFYPAHCDNICEGCEKNESGWCIWNDRAAGGLLTTPKSCDYLISQINAVGVDLVHHDSTTIKLR